MSLLGAVTDLQNATAFQRSIDRQKELDEAMKPGRKTGDIMGKHDFLMLLSAQLRHQDPLNPQSDADFASQLAQFSSLEQMQNMNSALETLSNYQAYGLVGKYVIAEAQVDGVFGYVTGVVNSVFTEGGIAYAMIGDFDMPIPVSSITEIFDSNNFVTSEMLMQTSLALIGRNVVAEMDGETIEGVVTRVFVDKGVLYAEIDDGGDEPRIVPVSMIVEIGEMVIRTSEGSHRPEMPPGDMILKRDGDGFIEYGDDGTPTARWHWDDNAKAWVRTPINVNNGGGGDPPPVTNPDPGEGGDDDPTVKDPEDGGNPVVTNPDPGEGGGDDDEQPIGETDPEEQTIQIAA